MIPINPKALAKLRGVQNQRENVFAYLVSEINKDKLSPPTVYEFYANPETIEQSFSSKWNKSGAAGVSKNTLQWYQGDNTEFIFDNLWVDAHFLTKEGQSTNGMSILPLINDLKKLKDREEGKRTPPILYFKWGSRSIGPCVLTECTIQEEYHLDGLPTTARISITLIEIPRPDEEKNLSASPIISNLSSNTPTSNKKELPVKLSEGAVKEGSAKAKTWLNNNISKIKGPISNVIKKGDKFYALATEPLTGLTKVKSGSNEEYIGIYDGRDFYPFDRPENIKKPELLSILKNNTDKKTVIGKNISELLTPGVIPKPSINGIAPGTILPPIPN